MEERRRIGRYVLCDAIAAGGMAQVLLGRLVGPAGFHKTVAIKRLHPALAKDPEFVSTILDEARLMSRINDAHVVKVLDVLNDSDEVLIVMDYVPGESLAGLLRAARAQGLAVPVAIATAVVADALHGLHAAHEATSESAEPLGIVHRDVSPHNILVGQDGVARVLDFGIAKARGRLANTADGQIKGKLAYMSPEQVQSRPVDRVADVYAAGAVLWELVTGKRLFRAESEGALLMQVLAGARETPSAHAADVPAALDEIVMRAIEIDPASRFETARQMAIALEDRVGIASHRKVSEWVASMVGPALDARATLVRRIESDATMAGDTETPLLSVPNRASPVPLDPAPRPIATRRGRWIVAGGLVAATALTALVWSTKGPAASARASALSGAASEESPASASAERDPAAPPLAPPSIAGSSPILPGSSPTDSTGRSSATAPPPALRTRPAPARTSAPAAAAPRDSSAPHRPPSCDPPYTVDERGVRRLKPSCN